MRSSLLPLVAFLPALVISTHSTFSTQTLPLYHRFISVSASDPRRSPFEKRGSLHVDTVADEAWLEETGTTVAELVMEEPGMNYQLAVGRTAETKPEDYNIIVVDSCVLFHSPSTKYNETLSLIYSGEAFLHLNFETTSIEACAVGKPGLAPGQWDRSGKGGEFKVVLDRGYTPDPVHFKELPPVVVGTDGKVVVPPKEKTFIEKYWVYALPIIAVIIIGGGGDEAAPAAAGAAAK